MTMCWTPPALGSIPAGYGWLDGPVSLPSYSRLPAARAERPRNMRPSHRPACARNDQVV
jgi:hypothetical protein